MIKLCVDMMGSDLGPSELADACIKLVNDYKDVSLFCFGKKEELTKLNGVERIEVVDCKDVVPMECGALKLMRLKESSMVKAITYMKDNSLDGVVSAGSTGGFITGCTLFLKNVPGVERAGFCAPFVTAKKNKQAVILDIGASNTNTGSELYGFAKLGKIYAETVLNEKNPTVYTLSNGAEEGKGTEEVKEAYKLLKADETINFKGNCEAREALDGEHDIIVTAGYPGNIFLKSTEGCASMMNNMIKKAFKRSLLSKIGYLFSKKGFDDMKETMDYRKTGGAILLGINGVAVKSHGNANAYAFYHTLEIGYRMAKNNIVKRVEEVFAK